MDSCLIVVAQNLPVMVRKLWADCANILEGDHPTGPEDILHDYILQLLKIFRFGYRKSVG